MLFLQIAQEARSAVAAAIAARLPEGTSADELQRLVQSIVIRGDLVINQGKSEEGGIIEDLVNSYHQQALSQAKAQFWFSVCAATVGFVFILVQATSIQIDNLASYMKITPGVIIDAVALLFFRQAEQTRERATALYDRLRTDKQMARSELLVMNIDDAKMKSAVRAQIALHMAGLKPKEIDLSSFLSGAS